MLSDGDAALDSCQAAVRKKSIRIKDFFPDFDKLRTGLVHPNHFVTAMGIAGIDKVISAEEIEALKQKYLVQKELCPDLVDYKSFCEDIDSNPCSQVKISPRKIEVFTPQEEVQVEKLLLDVSKICQRKGILVKPMFVDFANSNNSTKLVGHVTKEQFYRALDSKIGIIVDEENVKLLWRKYSNPDHKEMVNYVKFASDVLPDDPPYNPYTDA